jgi:hypothetical protein
MDAFNIQGRLNSRRSQHEEETKAVGILIHPLDCPNLFYPWVVSVLEPICLPVFQSLHSTPSLFRTARCPLLVSFTVRHLESRQH